MKAFHPQNCLYSIIADIKRRDHDQTVVTQSLNEEQIQSRKKLVSSLVNAWLAVAEQCLAVIQVSYACMRIAYNSLIHVSYKP